VVGKLKEPVLLLRIDANLLNLYTLVADETVRAS
jgi:hypothetical protein